MNINQKRKALHTGGCQCGAVRYALCAHPEHAHLCHCRMCQKAVGNAFAALAPVRLEDFAWTQSEPSVFLSSSAAKRGYCSACGTPLFFRYMDSEWIDVTIGSLDEPERPPPKLHYGVESRLSWLNRVDALSGENTPDGGLTGAPRRIVSYQHPDRDDPEPSA